MIARAGTCVCLSLVIVVVATIVLHRPEPGGAVAAVRSATDRKRDHAAEPLKNPQNSATQKPAEAPVATAKVTISRPKAAFDCVRAGETFADVARRVYGENADVQKFWKVNRDEMASPDAEVRVGTVLRTPDL